MPEIRHDMQGCITILGLETSCDDTCAAVVRDGVHVLSSIVSSQHEFHSPYGGVVPEVAARQHTRFMFPVIEEAMRASCVSWDDLSCIAVTTEPGLIGSLLVGVGAAKGIAVGRTLPILSANHLLAHVQSIFLAHPTAPVPMVTLVVSGGHTLLLFVPERGTAEVMGSTFDDAAGEAIDKGAHLLGLGYPGGPELDRLARQGNPQAVVFPRPLAKRSGLDFSFSGLKTALVVHVRKHGIPKTEEGLEDLCASYLEAIVEVLVIKSVAAARVAGVDVIGLTGGVAANSRLRSVMRQACASVGLRVLIPPHEFCTDNAAMVASLGHVLLQRPHHTGLQVDARATTVLPKWEP